MRQLFEELKFERVYHFTDSSSPILLDQASPDWGDTLDSTPTYSNLSRFLDTRFDAPFLGDGDNLWFFFAGHGVRDHEQDHLLLSDGYRRQSGGVSIPIRHVSDRLRRSGADNVILLIDACRNEGVRSGQGGGGGGGGVLAQKGSKALLQSLPVVLPSILMKLNRCSKGCLPTFC